MNTSYTDGQLAEMLTAAANKKGLSIKDLSIKLDFTYEHVRRMLKGEAIPPTIVLKALCKELDLDFEAAKAAATVDRIKMKFGDIPAALTAKTPGMEPLERLWPRLAERQKRDIMTLAKLWSSEKDCENEPALV